MVSLRLVPLVVLVACGPPAIVRLSLDGTHPDVYDARERIVYLDPRTIAVWEERAPGAGAWIEAHAVGHHWTLILGLDYGPGLEGQETGADCYAEHSLGHGPPEGWPTTGGYGPCPAGGVDRMRLALEAVAA